jgi:hypothetical protein
MAIKLWFTEGSTRAKISNVILEESRVEGSDA